MTDLLADAVIFNAGFSHADHTVTIAVRIFDEGYDPLHRQINPFDPWSFSDVDHCSYVTVELEVCGNEAFIRDLNAFMQDRIIFKMPRDFDRAPTDEKVLRLRSIVKLHGGI